MAAASSDAEEMPSSRDPNFNSLRSFMDGANFLSTFEGKASDEWGRFKDEDCHTVGTGKSFPSTFEMGDMAENSERSRPLSTPTPTPTPPEPFAIAEGKLQLLLLLFLR
jgi:hypothetical protein